MKKVFLSFVFAIAFLVPAVADEFIDSYVAYFSTNDHYNSKGVRLTSAAMVIAQDRANYHRFNNSDWLDEYDSFFTSVKRRQMVASMLNRGNVSAQVRSDILDWEMTAQVEIWRGASGYYLNIVILP